MASTSLAIAIAGASDVHAASVSKRLASATDTASASATPTYPVFPNGEYLYWFYMVSSDKAGLTRQDIDLRNMCYLITTFVMEQDAKSRSTSATLQPRATGSGRYSFSMRPDYQKDEIPCKRAAAINMNCYLQDTNGTWSGLQEYAYDFDFQQHCYCQKYPYFEAVRGCQQCFELHGGISGYHWFPANYIDAASSAYCGTKPMTTEFHHFIQSWRQTDPAASVTRTTAPDLLGTQTAASLYYTAPTSTSGAVGLFPLGFHDAPGSVSLLTWVILVASGVSHWLR